ncbi:GrpB family protein [Sorangium sp. So ce260]|uniref:GrpB family protein n=1 Tax=Sorangium sp. So ce260 TaxID=3133291 RepID=UPI003F613701
MPTAEEITKHHEPAPDQDPWVNGPPEPAPIVVVDHDERWPRLFDLVAQKIRAALGDAALAIEHVGSTSVNGLPSKPTIDVDLTVADPADELAYVPALSSAGFTLVIREPDWHEHRCLQLADPSSNVHVFGPGCPEVIRHRMFRQWLIDHPEDLDLYRRAKLAAASEISAASGSVMDYNKHKEPVIRAIYERMFRANGLIR